MPERASIISRGRRRRAFTLVELLVVVGIIAVMISILLPALARTRERAQRTACMSNLRQIGTAIISYSMDNRGFALPFEHYTPNGAAWTNTPWPLLLIEGKYLSAFRHKTLPQETTIDGPNVFRCPSGTDQLLLGAGPKSPYDAVGGFFNRCGAGRVGFFVDNWYAMNATRGDVASAEGNYNLYPFRAYPANSANGKDYRLQRFLKTTRAFDVVMVYDGSVAHMGNIPASLHARHDGGKTANLLMGDGRVENHPITALPSDPNSTLARVGIGTTPLYPKWRLDQP